MTLFKKKKNLNCFFKHEEENKVRSKKKFMNKSSLKSKALMNEFNNIIRGATSNEIIIDNNITSERQQAMSMFKVSII